MLLFASILCTLSLTSCQGNNLPIVDDTIRVSSVDLTCNKQTMFLDEVASLVVTINPSDATDKNYSFSMSKANVISINNNEITPLNVGDVTITVTTSDGGFTSSVNLIVDERNTHDMVNDKTLLNTLKDSVYKNDIDNENDFGITEPYAIGVDKTKLENEELYPVPTSDVTVYDSDVDAHLSFNSAYNSSNLNSFLLTLANVEGNKVIKFKEGTYTFSNTIILSSLKNVYLVGENTKFVFTGWLTYVKFENCKNCHLNNLIFDMNPSPTVFGTVAKVTLQDTTAVVSLFCPEEFDLTNVIYSGFTNGDAGSYAEYYLDSKTNEYVPDRSNNLYYNPGLIGLSYDSSTHYLNVTLNKSFGPTNGGKFKAPEIGTVASVAFRVYENHGFYVQNCTDTYMDDVTCYVASGMGLRSDNGKNLYLNRVKFIRDPNSKRLLTCCADILHTCNLDGEAVFTNCILEGSHDDAINIKTFYTEISSIVGNQITVKQTQNEVSIGYSAGDIIDVYNPTKLEYKDSYEVKEVSKNGSSYDLTLDKSVPSRGSNNYTGYLVGNSTKATKLKLKNSIIKNKRNRGILLQGRNSTIENCSFLNVVMGAVQILGVGDRFKEAIVPQNIVLKNNKFINCYDSLYIFTYDSNGEATSGTLHDVDVNNNFFYNNYGNSVYLKGVGNINVNNNLFFEKSSATYSIYMTDASKISVKNNATCQIANSNDSYNLINESTNVAHLINENNINKGSY